MVHIIYQKMFWMPGWQPKGTRHSFCYQLTASEGARGKELS